MITTMNRMEAKAAKGAAMERHSELSADIATWEARLARANERVAKGLDPDDNAEQDACVVMLDELRADLRAAESTIGDCNDVLIARGVHDDDDEDEDDAEETVEVPAALLRHLRDQWEEGDIAEPVRYLLAYLPDEE